MNTELLQSDRPYDTELSMAPVPSLAARLRVLTDRTSVVSNGVLSLVDQAIVCGSGFLTTVIIGRMTSADQLGAYYLVLSIVVIISGIQDQVVATPYNVYSKHRTGRDLEEFGGSMWLQHFATTAITVAALVVAAIGFWVVGEASVTHMLWVLVAATPLLLLRQGIRRFNFANLHLRSAIALDAAVALLQVGGLLLLAYYGKLSIMSIFAVVSGACGLACLAWYLLDRPSVHFVRERFMSDWRQNWNFGKWAVRSFLVGNTTPQLMLWLLKLAAGTAATGVFGACANIVGMTNVLLTGVDNILGPHAAHAFAKGGVAKLSRTLKFAAGFLGLALGALFLVVLLTGDLLVVLAFGPKYQGTGAILIVLTLSTLMAGMSMVVGDGLEAIDRPRSNFRADVATLVVSVVSGVVLLVPLGALGAALAILAGTSMGMIVRTVTLFRQLRLHGEESGFANASHRPSAAEQDASVQEESGIEAAQHMIKTPEAVI